MVWEDEQISSGLVAQETKPSEDAFSNSYFNQAKCKILNLSQCYCSHKHKKLDFTLFFNLIFSFLLCLKLSWAVFITAQR